MGVGNRQEEEQEGFDVMWEVAVVGGLAEEFEVDGIAEWFDVD